MSLWPSARAAWTRSSGVIRASRSRSCSRNRLATLLMVASIGLALPGSGGFVGTSGGRRPEVVPDPVQGRRSKLGRQANQVATTLMEGDVWAADGRLRPHGCFSAQRLGADRAVASLLFEGSGEVR